MLGSDFLWLGNRTGVCSTCTGGTEDGTVISGPETLKSAQDGGRRDAQR